MGIQIRPTEIPEYYILWKVPSNHKDSLVRTKLAPAEHLATKIFKFTITIHSVTWRDVSSSRMSLEFKWPFSSALISKSNLMIVHGHSFCLSMEFTSELWGWPLFPLSITLQPLNTCQLSVPLRKIERHYIQNYGKVFDMAKMDVHVPCFWKENWIFGWHGEVVIMLVCHESC